MTPLHWASKKGNLDIVKLLIQSGADYKAKDRVRDLLLYCSIVEEDSK